MNITVPVSVQFSNFAEQETEFFLPEIEPNFFLVLWEEFGSANVLELSFETLLKICKIWVR